RGGAGTAWHRLSQLRHSRFLSTPSPPNSCRVSAPPIGVCCTRSRSPGLFGGSIPRRVLRQDTLQGPAVHFEAAGGFRDVAIAQLEDPLDVLPAHPIGRHRVLGRLRRRGFLGEQVTRGGSGRARSGESTAGFGP